MSLSGDAWDAVGRAGVDGPGVVGLDIEFCVLVRVKGSRLDPEISVVAVEIVGVNWFEVVCASDSDAIKGANLKGSGIALLKNSNAPVVADVILPFVIEPGDKFSGCCSPWSLSEER